jgi:hypothetical protein
MPLYFDVTRTTTTHGTTLTELAHLRFATVAAVAARLVALYGSLRSSVAGGGTLRVKKAGTIGTGGTANTPGSRQGVPAVASTTAFDDTSAITGGTSPKVRLSVGMAQTGGNGGWISPFDPDGSIGMAAGGVANGNLEVFSLAVGTSVPLDVTAELAE